MHYFYTVTSACIICFRRNGALWECYVHGEGVLQMLQIYQCSVTRLFKLFEYQNFPSIFLWKGIVMKPAHEKCGLFF